jgi:dCMP deaminase
MKIKHLAHRIKTCLSLASLSPCKRRQFGCVVIDPIANIILSEGYNGSLRGSTQLCGGSKCDREGLKPGTTYEVGCVHAEQNAVYNAARIGNSLVGSWFIINGEPCSLCAKAIVQVGATKVICVSGVFGQLDGVEILQDAGVEVVLVEPDMSGLELALHQPMRLPRVREQKIPSSPFSKQTT